MSIEIKDIVSLTGIPGLHRIVKADDRAIIVESMDERKRRQMVRGNMMASKLTDVSIYTKDESEPLVNILKTISEKYGDELPVTKKSKNDDLMDFLYSVLPDMDEERVYPSNVKKLLGWYKVIRAFEVDLTWEPEGEAEGEESQEEAAETE
ncbi:MAG: DUF5606 domain-containing protein [Bacteroidota bacterium]